MASPSTRNRTHRLPAALIAALLLGAATTLALPSESAGQNLRAIGNPNAVKPSCPAPRRDRFPAHRACNAFGHVTGFQVRAAGRGSRIARVPRDGRIVAWSVRLTRPSRQERRFFAQHLSDDTFDRFGASPAAGISILNRVGRGRFKLTQRSPIVDLSDRLGQRPIITLNRPLRVKEGRIVALTTPTWLTNFAIANRRGTGFLGRNNVWRASRHPDRCENESADDIRNLTEFSRPHVRPGQTRRYACAYARAQIAYEAYLLPD